MPSKSKKQKRFMQMAAHASGRQWAQERGVKLPPKSVAEEFVKEDQKADKKKKKDPEKTAMTHTEKLAFFRPAAKRFMRAIPRAALGPGQNRAAFTRSFFQSNPEMVNLMNQVSAVGRASPQYRRALGAARNQGTDMMNSVMLNMRQNKQLPSLMRYADDLRTPGGGYPMDVSRGVRRSFLGV